MSHGGAARLFCGRSLPARAATRHFLEHLACSTHPVTLHLTLTAGSPRSSPRSTKLASSSTLITKGEIRGEKGEGSRFHPTHPTERATLTPILNPSPPSSGWVSRLKKDFQFVSDGRVEGGHPFGGNARGRRSINVCALRPRAQLSHRHPPSAGVQLPRGQLRGRRLGVHCNSLAPFRQIFSYPPTPWPPSQTSQIL